MKYPLTPQRGEIWLIDFEPQVAEEIKKKRPAVIINITTLEHLPIRIVLPLRDHKNHHDQLFYMVTIHPTKNNHLDKVSSIDCSQIKAFSIQRFIKKIGSIDTEELDLIVDTASYCIGR